MTDDRLFIFGYGNSSRAVNERIGSRFAAVCGTTRSADKAERIKADSVTPYIFDGSEPGAGIDEELARATHVLISIPPDADGDPVLRQHGAALKASKSLKWVCYLSTIGVYGDHEGALIDETAECRPVSARSKRRVSAEAEWMALGEEAGVPVAVMRLAGIYGPGHNVMTRLEKGTARRLVKPGQVFNRIHLADIAAMVDGASSRLLGGIYNGADDEAAPPQDVLVYGAELMGIAPPPEEPFDEAELTPMARTFYGETKIVSNEKAKSELGWVPVYPSYREGLAAMWQDGSWNAKNTSDKKR
ncbi:MAG: NAD(P)-dependent oxidoreductase [Hyphomicrobiales bacterium]|nr:MAG: NAD(P)-dependent oxidoreductase [Hyphomicrobiales bacterium]